MINASDISVTLSCLSNREKVNVPIILETYLGDREKVNVPIILETYLGDREKANVPIVFVEFILPQLPKLELPKIITTKKIISINCKISDIGTSEISNCGFLVKSSLDSNGYIMYKSMTIPTLTDQSFLVNVTGLPLGINYIAAFAENDAGRAVSDYVAYDNKGILVPGNSAQIMVGNVVINL